MEFDIHIIGFCSLYKKSIIFHSLQVTFIMVSILESGIMGVLEQR